MGIKVTGQVNGKIKYDIVPEYVPETVIQDIERIRHDNELSNGYSKERTMRHIGSIPVGVMYNYAMCKGIPPKEHNNFYSKNNGKNLLALLEEFPVLKTVDKPL